MNFELNEENFLLFAAKHYDNPHCKGVSEFNDDLKRFRYLTRLFRKYKGSGVLKTRLILNHLVVICNLFGAEPASKMLFFKIDKKFWPQLKTFMIFLNYMPPDETNIPIDEKIVNTLRQI